MSFIVPGVCRYTVHGELEGRQIANIWDMEIDTTGSSVSRPDAVYDQAGILINEWYDSILYFMVNDYTFNSVSWVDLDDADGPTGERSTTDHVSLPQVGIGTDPPSPSGVSFLVQKQLEGSSRSRRNGRCYIAGVAETYTDSANGNLVTPAYVADIQAHLDSFKGDVEQTEGGLDVYESHLVVVHILTRDEPTVPGRPGTPLTGDFTRIAALALDSSFAYQRRRAGR